MFGVWWAGETVRSPWRAARGEPSPPLGRRPQLPQSHRQTPRLLQKHTVSLEFSLTALCLQIITVFAERREQVQFNVAIGNVYQPKHLRMRTVKMK